MHTPRTTTSTAHLPLPDERVSALCDRRRRRQKEEGDRHRQDEVARTHEGTILHARLFADSLALERKAKADVGDQKDQPEDGLCAEAADPGDDGRGRWQECDHLHDVGEVCGAEAQPQKHQVDDEESRADHDPTDEEPYLRGHAGFPTTASVC